VCSSDLGGKGACREAASLRFCLFARGKAI
jgi:hypothetical protein